MKSFLKSLFKPLLGLTIGLVISLSLVTFAGESPLNVFQILIHSAFGSRYDLGLTLFYTTSLIFTGLSVAMAFHSGLFNIGAEGQLTVATLAAAWFAVSFPDLPPGIAPLMATVVGVGVGAVWGFIPGWLKAIRGSHEVIITMMMNFIAAAITSYITLELIRNPDSQNPETKIVPESYTMKSFDFVQSFFQDSPANLALIVALILAVLVYLFLFRTVWGYELRTAGQNPTAAEIAGMKPRRAQIIAMSLAGALAGMVCLNEVMGSSLRFKIGFSPDYGFVGIAVALLARNHPLGIVASAFLFGLLQKGASDLDLETEVVTRDFARVIQAVIIFSVAAIYFADLDKLKTKLQSWRKKK